MKRLLCLAQSTATSWFTAYILIAVISIDNFDSGSSIYKLTAPLIIIIIPAYYLLATLRNQKQPRAKKNEPTQTARLATLGVNISMIFTTLLLVLGLTVL